MPCFDRVSGFLGGTALLAALLPLRSLVPLAGTEWQLLASPPTPAAQCSMICRQQSSCRSGWTGLTLASCMRARPHDAAQSASPRGSSEQDLNQSECSGGTADCTERTHRGEAALGSGIGGAQHVHSRRLSYVRCHTTAKAVTCRLQRSGSSGMCWITRPACP